VTFNALFTSTAAAELLLLQRALLTLLMLAAALSILFTDCQSQPHTLQSAWSQLTAPLVQSRHSVASRQRRRGEATKGNSCPALPPLNFGLSKIVGKICFKNAKFRAKNSHFGKI